MEEKTKRFFEVLDFLKVSGYKLSKQSNLITQQKLTNARNGRNNISTDIVMELSRLYEQVNPNYIINGEGSMFLTGDITQSGNSSSNNSGIITTNNYAKAPISVPFYGELPVSAGQKDLTTVLGNMKPTGWLNIPGMPKSIGAFPVIGCSMEPDIRQGDFVCIAEIDRWESVDPDKIYMIITHDDRMIKRLALDNEDKEILWCISPNYPKFKVYKSEILAIYRITFYGRCT